MSEQDLCLSVVSHAASRLNLQLMRDRLPKCGGRVDAPSSRCAFGPSLAAIWHACRIARRAEMGRAAHALQRERKCRWAAWRRGPQAASLSKPWARRKLVPPTRALPDCAQAPPSIPAPVWGGTGRVRLAFSAKRFASFAT